MAITIQLPGALERRLRADHPDLERHMAKGYAVEAFRQGELSSHQVSQLLGLADRAQAVRFLSERGVYPGYSAADFKQDLKTLEEIDFDE